MASSPGVPHSWQVAVWAGWEQELLLALLLVLQNLLGCSLSLHLLLLDWDSKALHKVHEPIWDFDLTHRVLELLFWALFITASINTAIGYLRCVQALFLTFLAFSRFHILGNWWLLCRRDIIIRYFARVNLSVLVLKTVRSSHLSLTFINVLFRDQFTRCWLSLFRTIRVNFLQGHAGLGSHKTRTWWSSRERFGATNMTILPLAHLLFGYFWFASPICLLDHTFEIGQAIAMLVGSFGVDRTQLLL